MEENEIRKFIKKHEYTTYKLSKKTGLSINGLNSFMDGTRKPHDKTIMLLEDFVINEMQSMETKKSISDIEKIIKEPTETYSKEVTNKEIISAVIAIGEALLENGNAVSKLLLQTYENTTSLLSFTAQKQIEEIKKTIEQINNKLENKTTES